MTAANKKQQLFKESNNYKQPSNEDQNNGKTNQLNDIGFYKYPVYNNSTNNIALLYGSNEYEFQQNLPQPSQVTRKNALLRINQTPKPKSHQDFSWVTPAIRYNANGSNNDRIHEKEYIEQHRQISKEPLRRSVPNLIEPHRSPTKHVRKPIVGTYTNNLKLSSNDIFYNNNRQQHPSPQRNNNNSLRQSTPSLYPDYQFPSHSPVINQFQKCSYCNSEIGKNSAMIIETLNLSFHLNCFRCSVCGVILGKIFCLYFCQLTYNFDNF